MMEREEIDREELIRRLTPVAPKKPEPVKVRKMVWWRVKLKGDGVTAERDIHARTEDARDIAAYVAQNYPLAECIGIRRLKRAPRR